MTENCDLFQQLSFVLFCRLFVYLLLDSLNELAYPAQLADLSYDVVPTTVGVRMTASGYTHKLMTLVDMVLDHMLNLSISDDRFQVVKEQVHREFQNYKYIQPYQRAMYSSSVILENPRWHTDMYLAVIEGLAAIDVANFMKTLFYR